MSLVRLLPHQGQLVQAPFVYTEARFFFLVAGYASGKTSALVYAILYAVKNLLGKKDLEGHNPKILLGSKNLTFMKKTLTGLLEQDLRDTNSEYAYDKAHNIITIGNVELLLIPVEDESTIYGFSVCCFEGNTLIATDRGDVPIKDIKVGDMVLTAKGFRKVTHTMNQGVKDCIKVNVEGSEILCTPDHRFIDSFDNEIEAKDLTKTASLVKIDDRSWRKWLSTNGAIERSQKLLTSMEFGITDTQNQNLTESDVTILVPMRIREKVSRLCIEICGLLSMVKYQKGMMFTIRTETLSTTLWKTLNLLQELSAQRSIGDCNREKNENSLLKQLRRLKKETRNFSKTQSTGRFVQKGLKKSHLKEFMNVNAMSAEGLLQRTLKTVVTALRSARIEPETNSKGNGTRRRSTGLKGLVKFVEKFLRRTNIQLLRPARLTAKTSNAVGRYAVYDIEVEGCHEFFANGVRVHNCCFVDELDELPTQTAMAVVKSINDRCRQIVDGYRTPFMTYTTSSQGLKGTYQTIMHFKKTGMPYVLMRGRTRDNIYLPKDYVDNMYRIYNEKEVDCLLEGKFISIDSGLVFPDYDPSKNDLDEDLFDCLEESDTVYIGQDFNGFGNYAEAFVVKFGALVMIKCYKLPDIRHAPKVFRYDFPFNKIVWIPDMTYKEHFVEFKKELRTYNITIAYRSCNPLVQDRNFACNKLFFAEKLFVCPICKDAKTALLTHQKDSKTGLPMKGGDNAPDHLNDCMGYVVHYLLSWCRELKPLYDVTLRYIYDKRRARGADAMELEVAGRLLDANHLRGLPLKKHANADDEEEAS